MWRYIFIAFLVAWVGCQSPPPPPSPEPEFGTAPANVPNTIFTLQDEVIAVRSQGKSGAVFNASINLDPLREKVGSLDEVLLVEYGDGRIQRQLPHTWQGEQIQAELVAGKRYLIFAAPKGRALDTYEVLCQLSRYRHRIQPDLIRPICEVVLCSAETLAAEVLFDRFPSLESLRSDLDLEGRQIGGWPAEVRPGICERCTRFETPNLIYPVESCWTRPSVITQPRVVNMIPFSLSGESHQDSEPFLAVDGSQPNRMVGTAFTPNPFGADSGTAPVYVSLDGGFTWTLNNIIPSADPMTGTGDITVSAGEKPGELYGGILRLPGDLLLNLVQTEDFTRSTTMNVLESRQLVDQPFLQSRTINAEHRIYVGNNDLNASGGRTATLRVSTDAGESFEAVRLERRSTIGQDGPSVRPTIAQDGTTYAAFFGWRQFDGRIATSDVVVVRDDSGTGKFADLVDPSDGLPGRKVAENVTIPWSNKPTLGHERIGSTLSIVVAPNNSDVVYIAWADLVGDGDIYTIHVRRSTDRGETWSEDLRRVRNATNCALAIAENGTVGFLYQQYIVSVADGRWITRLEQSRNGFQTHTDTVLATVPGNKPAPKFLPYLGDYLFLLNVGNEFRGVFSANNAPNRSHFPSGVRYQRNANFDTRTLQNENGFPVEISIDPFYFSVPVAREEISSE